MRAEPHLECNGRIYRSESEPEDGEGPYSQDQLLQMNARFVQHLERAFANGDESRRCQRDLSEGSRGATNAACRGAMVEKSAAFSNERKINAKQALRASAAWLLPSLVAPLSTV